VPERLGSVLAGTLHDPSLQLAYWLPERNTFVDAAGAPVLVELARDRALTHLERDGETIADVTAEVGDAAALLDAADRDPPDAVVVDIRMPPTHTTEGLEAARALAARHPEVGVLVLRPWSRTTRCSSWSPARRVPAICSRSVSPIPASSPTGCAGWRQAAW